MPKPYFIQMKGIAKIKPNSENGGRKHGEEEPKVMHLEIKLNVDYLVHFI